MKDVFRLIPYSRAKANLSVPPVASAWITLSASAAASLTLQRFALSLGPGNAFLLPLADKRAQGLSHAPMIRKWSF